MRDGKKKRRKERKERTPRKEKRKDTHFVALLLNALEADAYARLRGGPMALAHAQLFSTSQMSQLVERVKFQVQQERAANPPESLP